MSLIEALAPPVTFDELFAFYRDSGFLYPGKLAAVDDRRDAVERTWRVLLGADRSVFRFISRLALAEGRPRLVNAICAFAYAPGTWQAQHLVSLQRREYTGTLALLLALSEWADDIGIEFARFSFRPNNPGTNGLFGGIAERLPSDLASLSLVDYGLTNLRDIDSPGGRDFPVAVRSLGSDEGAAAAAFYERVLDPVELDSLRLAQPRLHELDAAYALHGLTRRRTVLVALDGDRVVGACIVNHSSEGINFSFLENAIEYLRVAPDQPALTRRATWLSLARAAVAEVARTARLRRLPDSPRRPRSGDRRRPRPRGSQAILGAHRLHARGLRRHDRLLHRLLPRAPRRPSHAPGGAMTRYIMESEREAERLVAQDRPGTGSPPPRVERARRRRVIRRRGLRFRRGRRRRMRGQRRRPRPWRRCRRTPPRVRARRLPAPRTDRGPLSRSANRRARLIGTRGRSV